MKEVFLNEIYMYETIFPYFSKFQQEKGIKAPFDSFPKCYGSFTTENMEVIVLENLKRIGYELWPKRDPLSRKHIDMVVTQYGKFHAISLALQKERPAEFQEFVDTLTKLLKKFEITDNVKTLLSTPVIESYELLKNDLKNDILQKWKGLKDEVDSFYKKSPDTLPGLKVISHSDCWNNNFMYLHQKGDLKIPLKVAFLDWQMAKYMSPIMDLSYFLFSCISEEDLEELDDILITYHKSFINQLHELGVKDPRVVYPLRQLLNDWKSYSKYGVLSASLVLKIIHTGKDEVKDIGDVAESGQDFTAAFDSKIRDTENYKKRIRPIVEYVVKHELV
ncbi:uncharacterized protein LOC135144775 isoform X2 [Zophobas morio]|uniref:uncharacterized protein LOC135144775 isoform X2 n=1 Tax=Zophobas morio TaxID=2755281 RepID=UPI003082C793